MSSIPPQVQMKLVAKVAVVITVFHQVRIAHYFYSMIMINNYAFLLLVNLFLLNFLFMLQ